MVLTDMSCAHDRLEFLEQVKRTYPRIEVAVMTATDRSKPPYRP